MAQQTLPHETDAAPSDRADAVQGRRAGAAWPRRVGALLAAVAVLLVVVGVGALWAHSREYVSTDNAQIDGDQIRINAPASGRLVDWRARQGDHVVRGEVVGRIQLDGSGGQPEKPVRAPETGTVAQADAVEGQWVSAGTTLATA